MNQETLPPQLVSGPKRYALLICGWTNVVLGMIGAIVPGMPTTVFLLIALWAFTRSSPRCRTWLYTHPKGGPSLAAWSQYGVIPPRAKCLALTSMMVSFTIITALAAPNWAAPLSTGVILALVAAFIVTRPSYPPTAAHAPEHVRHLPHSTLTD